MHFISYARTEGIPLNTSPIIINNLSQLNQPKSEKYRIVAADKSANPYTLTNILFA